jgi:hypothetical protein
LEQEENEEMSGPEESSSSTTKVMNIKPFNRDFNQSFVSVAETDTKVVKINNMSVYSHDGMSS